MVMQNKGKYDDLVHSAREILSEYGRDYAIGALRGLAVRNMMSVTLPEVTPGFYPIVKIHEIALRDLEDIFYEYLQEDGGGDRETIIARFVADKVWE
jgi:hypothetical protein